MKVKDMGKLIDHLERVNALLPEIAGKNPAGAFCLGLLTAQAIQTGKYPRESVLRIAAQTETVTEAADFLILLVDVTDHSK